MKEEKMEHSPLPWKVTSFEYNSNPVSVWRQIVSEDNGYQIAADVEEADSNFIITACNSYYDNQEEIADLKREIQMKEDAFEAWIEEHAEAKAAIAELVEALERAKRTVKPFADRVYNDNGDMTVQGSGEYGDYCNAYWTERYLDDLIAKHKAVKP